MPRLRTIPSGLTTVVVLLAASCGDEPPPPPPPGAPAAAAPSGPTVTIVEPADGAAVQGPAVTVRLGAEGLRIVPAGDTARGTGHHHLYLDADLGEPGMPVPTVPGQIVHLGTGASEFTFENVTPGEHRLIAVVADGVHVPLQPWVVDTVRFTVR